MMESMMHLDDLRTDFGEMVEDQVQREVDLQKAFVEQIFRDQED